MTSFGLMLPQLRMSFETITERVQAAEEAGFDSVWFMDHLVAPAAPQVDAFEGWTVASALVPLTSRIRIGHLVLCNQFRHPAVLAKMAATFDVISGGRLELGIGWGSFADELSMFGLPDERAADRAARLAESLEILQAMFAGEPFDHAGDRYTLRGAIGRPVPVQPRIPVTIGGAGERLTLPLVNRFADRWNCPTYAMDRLDELRPLVREGIEISVQHPVGLASSSAERDEVAALAERRFGTWGGLVAGTPDDVAQALRPERDLGAELFIVMLTDFATPETIHRFMAEVAPALA